MIAKKLSIKTVVGFQERAPATLPKGIKTRRTLTLLLAAKSQQQKARSGGRYWPAIAHKVRYLFRVVFVPQQFLEEAYSHGCS
jgi:hypothetical protein